jgi:DNA mismatch endonuclease (patch repair protein)
MTDIWSPAKRSEVMSRIRGKDTRPERIVRSLVHALGFRFTVNGRSNRELPGKPDLVLRRHRCVVFVHGCFWHGHAKCRGYRLPSSNVGFWRDKILSNKARDRRCLKAMRSLGWRVLVVWECETRSVAKLLQLRARLSRELSCGRPVGDLAPDAGRCCLPVAAEEEAIYQVKRSVRRTRKRC